MSYISQINVTGLRNLNLVSLKLSPKVNLFYGENGSGKTSILESVSLLGHGRSFRSHKTKNLICHGLTSFTVYAEIFRLTNSIKLGYQKKISSKPLIKMDNESVNSASTLAAHLPLQILNSNSFQLIEGSPLYRRRFLDWMVFHVKPDFINLWKRFQRVIKQRNSLLRRDKISLIELEPWNKEFVELSLSIDKSRSEVFNDFVTIAKQLIGEFSSDINDFILEYESGWSNSKTLHEQLIEGFNKDVRDGYTHIGPQRADIRFIVDKKPAVDILSRGQEKSVISALHIAQAKLYQLKTNNSCVFLIDDMLAELDEKKGSLLVDWLYRLNGQVLITSVSKSLIEKLWFNALNPSMDQSLDSSDMISMFHVEQGQISPSN